MSRSISMPTLATWNLQGSRGVDLDAVAEVLEGADIALLQEVQRKQAVALAAALGWQVVWTFKHHPIRTAAEGLAAIARSWTGSVPDIKLRGGWPWSCRRRVPLPVRIGDLVVVDTHLGGRADEGGPQASRLVEALERQGLPDRLIVAGDLNAQPGSAVLDVFHAAGLQDALARRTRHRRDQLDAGLRSEGPTDPTARLCIRLLRLGGGRGVRPPAREVLGLRLALRPRTSHGAAGSLGPMLPSAPGTGRGGFPCGPSRRVAAQRPGGER